MLSQIFENITVLSDGTQQNQTQFFQAQKYLEDFSKQNAKNYPDFFQVINSSCPADMELAKFNQVQFWMANELIKIVESKDFIENWSSQERTKFKEYFFEWLYAHI